MLNNIFCCVVLLLCFQANSFAQDSNITNTNQIKQIFSQASLTADLKLSQNENSFDAQNCNEENIETYFTNIMQTKKISATVYLYTYQILKGTELRGDDKTCVLYEIAGTKLYFYFSYLAIYGMLDRTILDSIYIKAAQQEGISSDEAIQMYQELYLKRAK